MRIQTLILCAAAFLLISGTLISPARAQQSRAQAAAVVADFQKGLAGAPIARATLATRGLGYYLNTFCPSVYSDTDKCMSIAMDYLKGVPAPEGYDETAILVLELSREICGSAPVQKQNACLIGSINSHINIARNSVSRSEMARVRRSHILEFKKHINRCVVDIAPPRITITYPFGQGAAKITNCLEATVIPTLVRYYEN